jgi:DNA-binding NarL/FixJ family response regulator
MPKKEIARLLDISPKTVEKHCDHLMDKLDIHDRVKLARYAIREGLTQP